MPTFVAERAQLELLFQLGDLHVSGIQLGPGGGLLLGGYLAVILLFLGRGEPRGAGQGRGQAGAGDTAGGREEVCMGVDDAG